MRRLVALALLGPALAGMLAACDRKPAEQAAAPPPAPAGQPEAPRPLEYSKQTPAANVRLYLPSQVAKVPALYAELYAEGVTDLDAFADGAKGEVEELAAAGAPTRQLERELKWKLGAETPRLLGLYLEEYENTGGAHPNAMLGSLIWDKQTGKELKPLDLVRPGADKARLDRLVCDAVHAAKLERTGNAELMADQKCPTFAEVKLTLAPSTLKDRAGGVTVLISPYEIGPWAEGSYELTLPLSKLAPDIAPAYAAEFAGEPPPEPKDQAQPTQ
jgi:hypothetical protein